MINKAEKEDIQRNYMALVLLLTQSKEDWIYKDIAQHILDLQLPRATRLCMYPQHVLRVLIVHYLASHWKLHIGMKVADIELMAGNYPKTVRPSLVIAGLLSHTGIQQRTQITPKGRLFMQYITGVIIAHIGDMRQSIKQPIFYREVRKEKRNRSIKAALQYYDKQVKALFGDEN